MRGEPKSGLKQVLSMSLVAFRGVGVVKDGSVAFWGFGTRSRSRSASWWAGEEGTFVFGFSDAGSRAAADRKSVRMEKRRLGGNMFFGGFRKNIGRK